MAALQKNILEHISLMAQEQIQLEFREQIQQMQLLSQQAAQNPQAQQQLQQMQQHFILIMLLLLVQIRHLLIHMPYL